MCKAMQVCRLVRVFWTRLAALATVLISGFSSQASSHRSFPSCQIVQTSFHFFPSQG